MMLFLLYIEMLILQTIHIMCDDSYLKQWHRQLKGAGVGLSRCKEAPVAPVASSDLLSRMALTTSLNNSCL